MTGAATARTVFLIENDENECEQAFHEASNRTHTSRIGRTSLSGQILDIRREDKKTQAVELDSASFFFDFL